MTPAFRPAGPLFVRTATTPAGEVHLPGGVDAVRYVANHPALREAVEVASTSLGHYVDRIAAGAPVPARRLHSTAVSVSRYVLRGCTRATPFGLFAGVTTAGTGSPARAVTTGPGRKQVRADAEWLLGRLDAWVRSPEVRAHLDVVLDDRSQVRGDRLVLPDADPPVSLARTPLVAWVCERATRPVPYARLLAAALAERPDLDPDGVENVLAQLVERGVLLTSWSAARIDDDLLDRVETAVSPLPGAVAELRTFRAAVRAYALSEPGRGRAAWRELMAATGGDDDATRRPPVHVDLRPDLDVVLPPAVAEEVARYASAMWPLGGVRRPAARLDEYRRRFVERYGVDVAVPLGRLVDPHRGLGLPPADADAGGGAPGAATEPMPAARRALVAELVQQAQLDGGHEVVLTRDRVQHLADAAAADAAAAAGAADAAGAAAESRPPASLEVNLQLLADDLDALDRGDFLLASADLASAGLAGPAGRIVGRFAGLVGATAAIGDLVAAGVEDGALAAQLTFPTAGRRALNVAQVPRLLRYELPVGVFADRDDPAVLHWPDLLVSTDGHGLTLTHPGTGRQVVPVVPHMLGLRGQAPPVARLLADLAHEPARTWPGWDWCGLDALPSLPRIRLGRVVVSPRRWRPDLELGEAARSAHRGGDDPAWDSAVTRWRDRYGVPDRVVVVDRDRGHVLDLTDAWQRVLLRETVRADERCPLAEDLGEGGRRFGWAGGRATQVVVPLVRDDQEPARRTGPDARRDASRGPSCVRAVDRAVLPAESWLYAKLYAGDDVHDDVLAGHLPGLLRELAPVLGSWHFVRYRDPEPHLRLRFQGDPPALRGTVLPALTALAGRLRTAGLARAVTFDGYEPETERYGGADALPYAEHVFCVDSASALAQLRLRAAGRLELPPEVLGAVNHALLLESLDAGDWPGWVDRVFPKTPDHAVYQQHRDLARTLIRPGDVATSAATRLGTAVTRAWRDAVEPRAYDARLRSAEALAGRTGGTGRDAALRSLLHMQHNRLFCIDQEQERRAYAVLRGVVHDHLSRLAHERRARAGAVKGTGVDA